MWGKKLGHWVKSKEKLVYALEATFSVQLSWNLVRTFDWMVSQMSLKMGYIRSKTRSLGQILEKPCVHSGGQIFVLS